MQRFKALWKETWWLWLLFLVAGTVLSFFSRVFLVTFPVVIFTFIWFAVVRYDEEGNYRQM